MDLGIKPMDRRERKQIKKSKVAQEPQVNLEEKIEEVKNEFGLVLFLIDHLDDWKLEDCEGT